MTNLKTLLRRISRKLQGNGKKTRKGPGSEWCMAPISRAQALEPRILLDGAGLVTIAEPFDNPDVQDTATNDTSQTDHHPQHTTVDDTQALSDALAAATPQSDDSSQGLEGHLKNEVAFIDPNIQNYQSLIDGIRPEVEIIIIDGNQDGFAQMAEILSGMKNLDAIHIFSHGSSGQIRMGTVTLETDALQTNSDMLQTIKNSITEEGDVLVYGCSVASGDTGSVFLGNLAALTESDLAASEDPTGAENLGGDWDLEAKTGPIEAASAVIPAIIYGYDGLLSSAPSDIAFSNYDIAAGNSLVNGLGGASGFDTKVLATDLTPMSLDDGYRVLDISSVFGSGLKFGDTTYNAATQFCVGTNGYVTFGHGNTSFSAVGISGYTLGPMIAGQFDDIDMNDAPAQSAGGNSTGTHSLYYDIDTTTNVVTITYDDVGPYSGTAGGGAIPGVDQDTGNALQIRLHHINGSDFAIELRYENISWINGKNNGTDMPTAGWTAGDQTNYGEVTGSGTSDFLTIESASNIGQNGVFVWEVRNGSPMTGQNVIPEDAAAGTFVSALEITDADGGETHTCTLVDDDGGRFEIYSEGGTWKVRVASGATFDYETSATRTIRVKATGDTDGLSFEKDLTINLSDINEAPTAADKTVTFNEDNAYTFASSDFNFSDQDSGAALSKVKITSLESSGTLSYNNSGSWQDVTLNQEITKADIDANKLRFTPAANANGSGYDSFGFKVSDGTYYSASAYTVTVDVTAVHDAPTAANKTVTASEGTAYAFAALDFNFTDVDTGDALSKVKITSLESAGALAYNNSGTWQDVTLNQEITKADIDAGKLRFTPAGDANGSGYDSFGFKVSDGTEYSASAYTVTVDVTAVNDAPTGIALSANTIPENTPGATVGTLSATDPDTGDTVTFSIIGDDSGLFEISGTTLKLKSGSKSDFETASSHSVAIRVTDSGGATYDQTFTVNISDRSEFVPQNDAPDTSQDTSRPQDISFEPSNEGNQVVQGIAGYEQPGASGQQSFGESASGSALGNTSVTPSRNGQGIETSTLVGFSAGSFTGSYWGAGIEAGTTAPFPGIGGGNAAYFSVNRGIPDQTIIPGESVNFRIPGDAFIIQNQNVSLTYQAIQADGSPLPQWLTFSPETGLFTGTTPAGMDQTHIEVRVIVEDAIGNEAETTFKIEPGNRQDNTQSQRQDWNGQTHPADPGESLRISKAEAVNADAETPPVDDGETAPVDGVHGRGLEGTLGVSVFAKTLNDKRLVLNGKPSFSSQIIAASNRADGRLQDMFLSILSNSMEHN